MEGAARTRYTTLQSVDFVPPITERLSSPFLLLPAGNRKGNTSNALDLQAHLSCIQEYLHDGQYLFPQNEIGDSHIASELGIMENDSIPHDLTKLQELAARPSREVQHGGHPINSFNKSTRPGTHKGAYFYTLSTSHSRNHAAPEQALLCLPNTQVTYFSTGARTQKPETLANLFHWTSSGLLRGAAKYAGSELQLEGREGTPDVITLNLVLLLSFSLLGANTFKATFSKRIASTSAERSSVTADQTG